MTIPDSIMRPLNAGLRGQPAWGVTRGIGSCLEIELGPAQPASGGGQRGAWHLSLYMCDLADRAR